MQSVAHAAGCQPASELAPALCPLQLPTVRSVQLEPEGSCGGWSGKALRRYLQQAQRLQDVVAAREVLDWSDCVQYARIRFADQRQARLAVSAMLQGVLEFDGGAKLDLYCGHCRRH